MKKVAMATYNRLPNLKEDDRLIIDHLLGHGAITEPLVWDNDSQNIDDFDCCVIRSCWDYHLRHEEFLNWIRKVEAQGVTLWNPAHVIEWNMDKVYLRELEQRGVPIPPAAWFARGDNANLLDVLEDRGWNQAVVKPTISATAYRTWVTSREEAQSHQRRFEELLNESGVMVQQFVEEVTTRGEWSLMFFANEYSHAVLKRAKAGDFRVQDDFGGYIEHVTPPSDLIEQAKRIIDLVGEELLYTRVDGIDVNGELRLMELELIEPVLFLGENNAAPKRFADAIAARL
jgi:glutathione synthase/RimK-type ligase-like ATP-grasp enzyme